MNKKHNLNVYVEYQCLGKSSFQQRRMKQKESGVWKIPRTEWKPGCHGQATVQHLTGLWTKAESNSSWAWAGLSLCEEHSCRSTACRGQAGLTQTLLPSEFWRLELTQGKSSMRPKLEYVTGVAPGPHGVPQRASAWVM